MVSLLSISYIIAKFSLSMVVFRDRQAKTIAKIRFSAGLSAKVLREHKKLKLRKTLSIKTRFKKKKHAKRSHRSISIGETSRAQYTSARCSRFVKKSFGVGETLSLMSYIFMVGEMLSLINYMSIMGEMLSPVTIEMLSLAI